MSASKNDAKSRAKASSGDGDPHFYRYRPLEWDAEMDLISALLGAGSMMRADPRNARVFLAKLQGQLDATGDVVPWAHAVDLLVKGMCATLDSVKRGAK